VSQSRLLSVLVENKPGVLNRVASAVRRRGFNIDSLSVGPTDDTSVSRMTIAVHVGHQQAEQATKQLAKLIDVITIDDVTGQRLDRHRAAGVGGVPVALEFHRDHLPARREGFEQRPEIEVDGQQATE